MEVPSRMMSFFELACGIKQLRGVPGMGMGIAEDPRIVSHQLRCHWVRNAPKSKLHSVDRKPLLLLYSLTINFFYQHN